MLRFYTVLVLLNFLSIACAFGSTHPGVDLLYGANGLARVPTPTHVLRSWGHPFGGAIGSVAVSGGKVVTASLSSGSFAVVRFTPNGLADSAFNGGSARIVGIGNESMTAFGVDGLQRVIVAGYRYDPGTTTIIMYRLTDAGDLDESFGVSGRRELVLPRLVTWQGVSPAVPRKIERRPNGGFLVFLQQAAVVAFTAAGDLDTGMWTQGVYYTEYFAVAPNSAAQSSLQAIDGSDRLYVAIPASPGNVLEVKRIAVDGAIDTSYLPILLSTERDGTPQGARVDASGRLVLLLRSSEGGNSLARFTGAGAPDATFGQAGTASLDFSWPLGAFALSDLSASGKIVLTSLHSYQPSTAATAYLLFDENGSQATTFGGRGVSRFEENTFGSTGFIALGAIFAASGDELLVHGVASDWTSISLAKLRLSFRHRIIFSGFVTDPSVPVYGSGITARVEVRGDVGRPTGTLSIVASGRKLCDQSMFRAAYDSNFAYSCGGLVPAGLVTTEATYTGDYLYPPERSDGPDVVVNKARYEVLLNAGVSSPQLPKDRFPVSIRWSSFRADAPVAGVFEVTDGVSACTLAAGDYDQFSGAVCWISIRSPGRKRLYVRHLGDPNFETDTTGETFIDVAPARSSLTVRDFFARGIYELSFSSPDEHCGFKYATPVSLSDAMLPTNISNAWAKNGAFRVTTVSDCTPGFSGTISVVPVAPTESISSVWALSTSGSWTRFDASSNETPVIPFVDDSINDTTSPSKAGEVSSVFVPNGLTRESRCVFDVYSGLTPEYGVALLRFALGFTASAVLEGMGSQSFSISLWLRRVTCRGCASEIDINGTGSFDLNDAMVILRRMQGLSLSQQLSSLVPVTPADNPTRTLVEAQDFLQRGCR
jgi:Domain of unknown function (DUF5122) beta-propeller